MNTKIITTILLIIVALSFVAGVWAYPQLPDMVASHWDASGNVNGYMSKFWGTFLLPFILLGLILIYFVIPIIDPLKENIKKFRAYYDGLFILLELFMGYIYALTLFWNLGYRFNFTVALVPAIAVLWFFLGIFLKNIKPNWFMGIRTPWTLSNEVVWEKTHKLGGKLFQAAAVISLLGLFLKGNAIIFAIIIPAVLVAVITVAYSYFEYKKIKKQ